MTQISYNIYIIRLKRQNKYLIPYIPSLLQLKNFFSWVVLLFNLFFITFIRQKAAFVYGIVCFVVISVSFFHKYYFCFSFLNEKIFKNPLTLTAINKTTMLTLYILLCSWKLTLFTTDIFIFFVIIRLRQLYFIFSYLLYK